MEISPSRKRPRPVVSCLRCREKKLKCDRATPCQNCTKAGCRAECTYNQHPHLQSSGSLPKAKRVRISPERDETDQQSQSQSRSGTGIIEDLQQRVVKLEELLAVRPHAGNFGLMRDAPVQSSWYVFLSSSYELFFSRTSSFQPSFQPSSSTSLSSLISFSYFPLFQAGPSLNLQFLPRPFLERWWSKGRGLVITDRTIASHFSIRLVLLVNSLCKFAP